jgi:hypothetical protein
VFLQFIPVSLHGGNLKNDDVTCKAL